MRFKALYKWICILIAIVLFTGGCSKTNNTTPSLSKEQVSYNSKEMILLVASQKAAINELYGDEIWNASLKDGLTYKDVFMDDMNMFIKHMYLLGRYAEEYNIFLDSSQEETIDKAVTDMTASLAQSTGTVKNCTTKEISDMYKSYLTAETVMSKLMSEQDIEVSESEARVIKLRIIVINDIENAKLAKAEIDGGADFTQTAKKYSFDDNIEREISKGDLPEQVETQVYMLEDDQVSSLIEDNNNYYIVQCVDSYDEEATKANKEKLELAKAKESINSTIEDYQKNIEIEIDMNVWNEVKNDDSTINGKNFFSCLQ